MMTNRLPDGISVRFPRIGAVAGEGFGLAGAVTFVPGEFQWDGIAGTREFR